MTTSTKPKVHTATCTDCGYTTAPQAYQSTADGMVARHRRACNGGEQDYTCHCGKTFTGRSALTNHARFAHDEDENTRIWDTPLPGPWAADALCAQVDGELWFPEKQGSSPRTAKALCATCPVQAACLQYALDNPSLNHGIYGGTTPRERAALRNERNAA